MCKSFLLILSASGLFPCTCQSTGVQNVYSVNCTDVFCISLFLWLRFYPSSFYNFTVLIIVVYDFDRQGILLF